MKRLSHLLPVLAIGLMAPLSACVTEPQPCTPEWVEWKSDQILSRFARGHYDTIDSLRSISSRYDGNSAMLALQMASMADDFLALARDFDRIVLPELNDAVARCSQPRNFVPAFTQFLRNEGVDSDIVEWVEVLGYVAIERNY